MKSIERGYHPITEIVGNTYTIGKKHKTEIVFSAPVGNQKVPDAEINVRGLANRLRLGGIDTAFVDLASQKATEGHTILDQRIKADPVFHELSDKGPDDWSSVALRFSGETPKELNASATKHTAKAGTENLLPSIAKENINDLLFAGIALGATVYTVAKGYVQDAKTMLLSYMVSNATVNAMQYAWHKMKLSEPIKENGFRFSLFAGYPLDRVGILNGLKYKKLIREPKSKK